MEHFLCLNAWHAAIIGIFAMIGLAYCAVRVLD